MKKIAEDKFIFRSHTEADQYFKSYMRKYRIHERMAGWSLWIIGSLAVAKMISVGGLLKDSQVWFCVFIFAGMIRFFLGEFRVTRILTNKIRYQIQALKTGETPVWNPKAFGYNIFHLNLRRFWIWKATWLVLWLFVIFGSLGLRFSLYGNYHYYDRSEKTFGELDSWVTWMPIDDKIFFSAKTTAEIEWHSLGFNVVEAPEVERDHNEFGVTAQVKLKILENYWKDFVAMKAKEGWSGRMLRFKDEVEDLGYHEFSKTAFLGRSAGFPLEAENHDEVLEARLRQFFASHDLLLDEVDVKVTAIRRYYFPYEVEKTNEAGQIDLQKWRDNVMNLYTEEVVQ